MTPPRPIIALALLLWGALAPCAFAKPVLVVRAESVPPVEAEPEFVAATIGTNGTTTTVTFTEAVVAANANGFTLTPSGGTATLTYVSGSGTTTLVFTANRTIYDDETATLAYSSTTGDVEGLTGIDLETFGAQAVTNNSTQEDGNPDLPQNVPTAALPPNWNATADYTPANNTVLAELVDGDGVSDAVNGTAGDWTIIQLTAGQDYEGGIRVDDSCRYILFRASGYASLPAFDLEDSDGRVTVDDEANMATISRQPTGAADYVVEINGGDGVPGASNIRFLGVKFVADGTGYASNNYLAVISCITGTTGHTIDELPEGLVFDRCAIATGGSVKVHDAIRLDANDWAAVGCNFYNLYGGGNDGSNAIRSYVGSRGRFQNSYAQVMGASLFLGDGENPGITISDIAYRFNHHDHPTAWDDGSHGITKSAIEAKVVSRLLIENSVIENQALASYNAGHAGITIKSQSNTSTHVTIKGVKLIAHRRGFALACAGSNPGALHGPNTDFLLRDVWNESSDRGISATVGEIENGQRMQRVKFIRNTFIMGTDGLVFYGAGHESGAAHGVDLIVRDCVATRGGFWADGSGEGSQTLNNCWGPDYSFTYNFLIGRDISAYDNDTVPAPLGTLTNNIFPANIAAMGFTNSGAGDYSISDGSPYKNSSSTGGKPGYDSATYDSIWAEVMGE